MQGKRICKKLYPNSDLRDKICSFYWMKSFRGRMALHYYGMDTYYHLDYKRLKYPFVCGLMTVYKGNGEAYGYMNENGKMVIPYKYKSAFSFSEKSHMALVNIHGSKWGLIKTDGTCSMFLKFDMVSLFADEVYSVALSNKWGLIDSFGKEILVPKYQYIGTLNDGLAIYKDDDKYGFLNKYGNVVIKAQYEKVFDFICGYATFQKDGKFGYINHDNKIVVPPIYESCTNFTRIMRIAAVKKKGYWGLVDTEGNELTDFCYNKIEMYDKEKYVIAYIGKKRYTIYFDDMKKHIL